MVLKTISPGCGVQASSMLFLMLTFIFCSCSSVLLRQFNYHRVCPVKRVPKLSVTTGRATNMEKDTVKTLEKEENSSEATENQEIEDCNFQQMSTETMATEKDKVESLKLQEDSSETAASGESGKGEYLKLKNTPAEGSATEKDKVESVKLQEDPSEKAAASGESSNGNHLKLKKTPTEGSATEKDKVESVKLQEDPSEKAAASGESSKGKRLKLKKIPTEGSATAKVPNFKLQEKSGDLFSCPSTDSLAHCISADVKMGAGIAVQFRKRFGNINSIQRQSMNIFKFCQCFFL